MSFGCFDCEAIFSESSTRDDRNDVADNGQRDDDLMGDSGSVNAKHVVDIGVVAKIALMQRNFMVREDSRQV